MADLGIFKKMHFLPSLIAFQIILVMNMERMDGNTDIFHGSRQPQIRGHAYTK